MKYCMYMPPSDFMREKLAPTKTNLFPQKVSDKQAGGNGTK